MIPKISYVIIFFKYVASVGTILKYVWNFNVYITAGLGALPPPPHFSNWGRKMPPAPRRASPE